MLSIQQKLIAGFIALSMVVIGFTGIILNHPALPSDINAKAVDGKLVSKDFSIPLHPRFFIGSAQDMQRYYPNQKALYFEDRAKIYQLLSDNNPSIVYADGTKETINPNALTIAMLPKGYWMRIVFGLIVGLVAYAPWAFRPRLPETRYFMAAGFCLMFITLPSAADAVAHTVYLNPSFAWWLSFANGLCTIGNVCFGAITIVYFPAQLNSAAKIKAALYWTLALSAAVILFSGWKSNVSWYDQNLYFNLGHIYAVILLVYFSILTLCALQWQASKGKPLIRARAIWITICWTFWPGLFVSLYMGPILMGQAPLLDRNWSWAVLSLSYSMTMIGVARLNLFNLDQHIHKIAAWAIGSILFVIVDIVIINALGINLEIGVLITVVATIFVYAPVRQIIRSRILRDRRETLSIRISKAISALSENPNALDGNREWRNAIANVFSPLSIQTVGQSIATANVGNRGQHLNIPASRYTEGLVIEYVDRGNRLFNDADAELATSLLAMYGLIQDVRTSYQQGQQEERDRLRRELHDHIGHDLLKLCYATSDQKSKDIASNTLSELRNIISELDNPPIDILELGQKIAEQASQMTRLSGHQFNFQDSSKQINLQPLKPLIWLNIVGIAKELLSNTVRHSKSTKIRISLNYDQSGAILFSYSDDGDFDLAQIQAGNGLKNISERCMKIGGDLHWKEGRYFPLRIELSTYSYSPKKELLV